MTFFCFLLFLSLTVVVQPRSTDIRYSVFIFVGNGLDRSVYSSVTIYQ